jgi:hypothetical protein
MGFQDVSDLLGGYGAWAGAGLPVAHDAAGLEPGPTPEVGPAAAKAQLDGGVAVSWFKAGVEWRQTENRTSPRRCWGDVRAARVIGLPSVHNAPRCSVSASAQQDRVLTQTRGAEPHRGLLSVGARCCSCWERQPGGRTFSADTALACQRSLPEHYSAIRPATRGAGDRPTTQLGTPRPAFRSPGVATGVW